MGYCMGLVGSSFHMKKENLLPALAAMKEKLLQKSYSWVNDWRDMECFGRVMKEWRWELDFDKDGDVDGIDFTGEKLGNDKDLFEVIAPFVESGSYIKMLGEDGGAWEWMFKDGKLTEKTAEIYGDDEKIVLFDQFIEVCPEAESLREQWVRFIQGN